ncbi:MAG: DUF4349 domain-containing protein [Caldilineaceae bacterium]
MRSADTGGVVAELAMDTDSDTAMLPAAQVARKVIANASMTLVVSDTETMVDQIEALLDQVGGYVSDANLYKSSYGDAELLRGSLTVRVPAEHLNTVMEQLSQIAVDVRSENLTREDVTDQFSDIEAQLRNLRNTETELQALLSEVRERPNSTPQDIMAVYDNLTVIRGQIEQLQGRQNMLDNLVGLSTLTLELIPDAINQPLVDAGWRPAVVVRDATRALVNTLEALGSAVIWFVVYLLPILILVAIPVVFLIWLLRKGARRLSRSRS